MRIRTLAIAAGLLSCVAAPSRAAVRITEWMYNPVGATNFEYFELTNLGPTAVDLTGWSFDDGAAPVPGSLSLTPFGSVAVGESVIVTEGAAGLFRTEWTLSALVKVIGGSTQNLSRDDAITIFDASNAVVDKLAFNDAVAGPRTQGKSGNPITLGALGANDASQWKLAVNLDSYGSYLSTSLDIGNPGKFLLVPEPTSAGLAGVAVLALGWMRRRSRRVA